MRTSLTASMRPPASLPRHRALRRLEFFLPPLVSVGAWPGLFTIVPSPACFNSTNLPALSTYTPLPPSITTSSVRAPASSKL